MRIKIDLYVLSLWMLFFLLFCSKIEFSVCLRECEFIGIWPMIMSNWIPTICLVGMLYGIYVYYRFRYLIMKSGKKGPWEIKKVESISFENLSFLATFIIPLLCFDLDFNLEEGRNAFMLVLVLVAIGAIYIKANLYYTNPSLALVNFKIFKIDYLDQGKSKTCLVLTREKLTEGDEIFSKLIGDNIYYSRKAIKNEQKGS